MEKSKNTENRMDQNITPEMIWKLITLLQQVIDTSGQGRMAEQISSLIKELNTANASIIELTQAIREAGTGGEQIKRIEAKLDTLLTNLIDPG